MGGRTKASRGPAVLLGCALRCFPVAWSVRVANSVIPGLVGQAASGCLVQSVVVGQAPVSSTAWGSTAGLGGQGAPPPSFQPGVPAARRDLGPPQVKRWFLGESQAFRVTRGAVLPG